MNEAIKISRPVWQKSMNLPFIQELKTGKLSKDRFNLYLEQDNIYLLYYVKLCGKAIYNSKGNEEISLYLSLISFAFDTEIGTRTENLDKKNSVNVLLENQRYIDFIMSFSNDYNNDRILLVLLHCMLSYQYVFTMIAKDNVVKNSEYYFFIKDYLSDDYRDACNRWTEFANKKYSSLSESKKIELIDIFKKASLLEYDFWNMAYEGINR
jgi:thiaminase/transcriptional activator TenA